MDEDDLEKRLQEKGCEAPRLSPSDIDAVIEKVDFHVFPETTLTVACLHLRNGFCVTGESAAAAPENFDAEIGRQIAFRNGREKIWALEGYRLKQRMFEAD